MDEIRPSAPRKVISRLMAGQKPLTLVAGTGLFLSLLSCFEEGGFQTAWLKRSAPGTPLGAFHLCDLFDLAALPEKLLQIIGKFGTSKIVIHIAAELVIKPLGQTRLADYQRSWASMVESTVLLGQDPHDPIAQTSSGSFMVSGATASLRESAKFSAVASPKFALQGLIQSLYRGYRALRVHVAISLRAEPLLQQACSTCTALVLSK